MRVIPLLIISFFSSSSPLLASSLRDSIGVEDNNGKEVVIHKIEAKETYYLLGRKYGVPVKTIIAFNDSKPLHPGTIVKVPTERPFGVKSQEQAGSSSSPVAGPLIEYKVGPKETLYAIAKRFDTTVEDIRELNNLKGNALAAGQIIKVHQGNPEPQQQESKPAPPVQKPATPAVAEKETVAIAAPDTSVSEAEMKLRNRYGIRQHDEHGVGVWIADENIDSSKMLALHNSVPPNTIIKVTNPMNGKSTFVKVIGRYTENETTKDVIIVITKAVADLLGIIDKRFQVNIVYGPPNEN